MVWACPILTVKSHCPALRQMPRPRSEIHGDVPSKTCKFPKRNADLTQQTGENMGKTLGNPWDDHWIPGKLT